MDCNTPHLTLEQQLSQLDRRGMVVDNRPQALRLVETVGYY
ncbi:hypothetical protein ACFPJ4_07655 [Lysinimonas soli]|uniref:Uncharacterized protein n=1 Tax=Lysinimonas soli TaxID=1074233 RepID=A0ABW0NP94_9MICO